MGLFVGLSSSLFAQPEVTCERARLLVELLEARHYSPRPVDDEFSKLVFDQVLEDLDPEGLFLTKEDVDALSKHQLSIDDQITGNNCEFVAHLTDIYQKRLDATEDLLNGFRDFNFVFDKEESLVFRENVEFLPEGALMDFWRKNLKSDLMYAHWYAADSAAEHLPPTAEELQRWRQETIEQELCPIKALPGLEGGIAREVSDHFLQAVANAFDPHTYYLSASGRDNFATALSRETYGFGLRAAVNEQGNMEISEILPGSAAWRSNRLHEGDLLLFVTTPDGETHKFDCLHMQEISELMRSEDVHSATFLVRKQGGEELEVNLHKATIEVQENVITSFVLEGDPKIGYIRLPSFYTQMEEYAYLANGCANDVAKELLKLKREGISGLIFDLRDNGGGSMEEALRLAGSFIDYGALAVVDGRDVDAETLKDQSRGKVFRGPMTVLVNAYSASASELFAASMQDQNRAVIVGSPTFGKSTVQIVLPLTRSAISGFPSQADYEQAPAYVKLTQSKFYRVTGKSHQLEGVQPDILLPHVYDDLETGEANYPTALPNTSIQKKTYYFPAAPLPLADLIASSQKRVATHPGFEEVQQSSKTLAATQSELAVPLKYSDFIAFINENPFTTGEEDDSPYTVKNPSYLIGISSLSDPEQEINNQAMSNVQRDLYVNESYRVLVDLINLNAEN